MQQTNTDENEENNRENDRQKILTEAMQMGDVNTRRIFSYQEKAPSAPESHQNPLRVVYSIKTPLSTKSGSRYIPTSPERILDAPDIINDYCEYKHFSKVFFKVFVTTIVDLLLMRHVVLSSNRIACIKLIDTSKCTQYVCICRTEHVAFLYLPKIVQLYLLPFVSTKIYPDQIFTNKYQPISQ